LRVCGDASEEGGCIRGPEGRKKGEYWEGSYAKAVCCDPGQSGEVNYFRALFNAKKLLIRDTTVPREMLFVGYESPLMRVTHKKVGEEYFNSRILSCDLVGMENSCLYGIEGKTNSGHEDTGLAYALLESFAYGCCLQYHIDSHCDDLKKEIHLCRKIFQGINEPCWQPAIPLSAKYFIAAPSQYYADHVSNQKLIGRLQQARRIEMALAKSCPKEFFGGYLMLPDEKDQPTLLQDMGTVEGRRCPVFSMQSVTAQLFPKLESVDEYIR